MRTVGFVFDTQIQETEDIIPDAYIGEENIPDINDITDEDKDGGICFDKMTVTQLRRFAKDNGIDIGSSAKKDEIISAIIAAGNDMDEEDETEV